MCGAIGPAMYTAEEAEAAWNNQALPKRIREEIQTLDSISKDPSSDFRCFSAAAAMQFRRILYDWEATDEAK